MEELAIGSVVLAGVLVLVRFGPAISRAWAMYNPWPRDPNGLLTFDGPGDACYLLGMSGQLVPDPEYGTAIVPSAGNRMVVAWPRGYSARYFASEVEVLDWHGNVVAITGRRYDLQGPSMSGESSLPTSAFTACGFLPPHELS